MSTLLLLVLLLLLALLVLFNIPGLIWRYYNLCKAMRRIPSYGRPHWLWGHLPIIELSHAFAVKMYNWRVKNDISINHFWIGPFRAIVYLHRPEYIKNVLKTPKAADIYGMLEPWLGRGLLIENGQRWLKNRRLLTPAFHFDVLKPYVDVYNDCTDILLKKWEKCAIEGTPVGVYSTINLVTLDVILRCACSHFSGCQEKDTVDPYVQAVLELTHLAGQRYLSPILTASNFLYYYCSFQGWRYRKALAVAHGYSEKLIRERKASLKKNKEMEKYFHKTTTLMLILANSDYCNEKFHCNDQERRLSKSRLKCLDFLDILLQTTESDEGLSDLEIRHEVDTFVFEGYDTTANALTWTLYYLAKYPEHQQKCREEIKDVLRGRSHLDYDDLPKLQYTQCCIKESMRRNPPVYNGYRDLTEDTQIGGYYIPKETMVVLDIFGIHNDPQVWDRPLEYDPLRFHPDHIEERDPFAFIPFSAGPRNCIGQNFAFNEEQIVVASILNKFSLEITNERIKDCLEFTPEVLLRPSEELYLNLTLIN